MLLACFWLQAFEIRPRELAAARREQWIGRPYAEPRGRVPQPQHVEALRGALQRLTEQRDSLAGWFLCDIEDQQRVTLAARLQEEVARAELR